MLGFVIKLWERYRRNEIAALGAQMTYYWILAFFPFLIFMISLFSFTPVAQEEFLNYLSTILPHSVYVFIYATVRHLIMYRSQTLLSISAIGSIWAASAGIDVLMHAFNKAYDQEENRPYWRVKPISIFYTIMMALLIVVTFVLLIFGNALGVYFYIILGVSKFSKSTWDFLRIIGPIGPIFILFMMMYRFIPNHISKCKMVFPGTTFTTISWYFFSYLFSIYINNFGKFNQMYGSLGGIFFVLIWLYVSSIVILIGAEINALWERITCGKK